jgi:serine/threonine-protein kinase
VAEPYRTDQDAPVQVHSQPEAEIDPAAESTRRLERPFREPSLDPGQTFGEYRIQEVLGRGGWGVVYRATDPTLDRPIALKLIRPEYASTPEARERFLREAKAAAAVHHPNIVPIYRAGDVKGQLFIAMLFVDGFDLQDLVETSDRLDTETAVEITERLAAALQAAHDRGLVHRDVKPANVLVDGSDNRHVYLTDFGIAKMSAWSSSLTAKGFFLGTVDFMAPEQLEGERVDKRADIYSLGGLLFFALSGRAPYVRDSLVGVMNAHLNNDPPSLRDTRAAELADRFDDVIATAMAKQPADRFPTVDDLAVASREALTGPAGAKTRRTAGTKAKRATAAKTKPTSGTKTKRATAAKTRPTSGTKTKRATAAKTKPTSGTKTKRAAAAKTKPTSGTKTKRAAAAKTRPTSGTKTKPSRPATSRPTGIHEFERDARPLLDSLAANAPLPSLEDRVEWIESNSERFLLRIQLRYESHIIDIRRGWNDKLFVDREQLWKGDLIRNGTLELALRDGSGVWKGHLIVDRGLMAGIRSVRIVED